jgi:excisionase family DNA binding protein
MEQSFLMTLSGAEFKGFLREALTEILREGKEKATHQQNEIFDVTEAAAFLKLKKSTLYEKTALKLIPHVKKGHKLYFNRIELEEWLREGKVKTMKELQSEAATYTMHKPLRK